MLDELRRVIKYDPPRLPDKTTLILIVIFAIILLFYLYLSFNHGTVQSNGTITNLINNYHPSAPYGDIAPPGVSEI